MCVCVGVGGRRDGGRGCWVQGVTVGLRGSGCSGVGRGRGRCRVVVCEENGGMDGSVWLMGLTLKESQTVCVCVRL